MQSHTINVTNFGDAAGAFIDAGFPARDLLPLIPPDASLSSSSKVQPGQLGKIPGRYTSNGWCGLTGAWPTFGLSENDRYAAALWPTHNVGLRAADYPAIDIDTDSEAGRALAAKAMEGIVATDGPIRTRREAPRALYMYKLAEGSEPIRKRRLVWQDAEGVEHAVEVLGFGQQYVVAGVHPSGSAYVWDRQPEADKLPELSAHDVKAYMERLEALIDEAGGTVVSSSKHGAGSSVEIDYANADPQLPDDLVLQALDFIHNDAETLPTREDLLRVLASVKTALGRNAENLRFDIEAWATRYGWADTDYFTQQWDSLTTSRTSADHLAALARQRGFAYAGAVLDFAGYETTEGVGGVNLAFRAREKEVANVHNLATTLRQYALGLFRYNELAYQPMLMHSLYGAADFAPRKIEDNDYVVMQALFQKGGYARATKLATIDAVNMVARENTFHPVREYLNSVQWDGVRRLDTWLPRYTGATDTEYTRFVGPKFIIAAVARVFEPGSKVDTMLVLEGRQGKGKSATAKILGEDYFGEIKELSGKDTSIHLQGKWIIEFPEMVPTSQADQNALKSFLSSELENYRGVYEKAEKDEPRQCVFIGTTNDKEYLRDPTGARRFWPVETGEFDLVALKRDRDQLFAEAVVRFQKGEKWWCEDESFEARVIRPEQEARTEISLVQEVVQGFLADKTSVTMLETASAVVTRIGGNMSNTGFQRQIGAAMRSLGWDRRKSHGKWVWEKSSAPAEGGKGAV